jgi:hypothetical protein
MREMRALHDGRCAKGCPERRNKCDCKTCGGTLHGIGRSNALDGIRIVRDELSVPLISGNNELGKFHNDCVTFYFGLVSKNYYGSSIDCRSTALKLSKEISERCKTIKDALDKNLCEFERDPESYITNYCLDTLSKELSKQTAEVAISQFLSETNQKKSLRSLLKYDHLFCVICVAVLKLLEEVRSRSSEFASVVAEEIIDSFAIFKDVNELTKAAAKCVLEIILAKALGTVFTTWILSQLPPPFNNEMVIRVTGLIACPNIEDHSDVVKYCAKPLLKEKICEKLTPIIRQQLKEYYDQVTGKGYACPMLELPEGNNGR